MKQAHYSLNDRLLQNFCVVKVWNGEDSLTAHQNKVSDSFEMLDAEISALQEQLPDTHQYIEL